MDESSPCGGGGAGLLSRGATEAGRLCSVSVLCRADGIANGGVGAGTCSGGGWQISTN